MFPGDQLQKCGDLTSPTVPWVTPVFTYARTTMIIQLNRNFFLIDIDLEFLQCVWQVTCACYRSDFFVHEYIFVKADKEI